MQNIQIDLSEFQSLASSQIHALEMLSSHLNFNPIILIGKVKHLDAAKANNPYKQIFFKLTDGFTTVKAVADREIVKDLRDGSVVKVTCFCQPWLAYDKQSLEVKANIIQIQPFDKLEYSAKLDFTSMRLKELKSKPHRFPTHQNPSITLISSNATDAVTEKDFRETLGLYEKYICLESKPINLSDPQALKLTIENSTADILIIVRGGGNENDLESFDHEVVLEALAHYKGYRIMGIGHATNHNLVNLISDYSAITPTAAAEHLKDQLIENYKENKKNLNLNKTIHQQKLEISELKKSLIQAQINSENIVQQLSIFENQISQTRSLSANQYKKLVKLIQLLFMCVVLTGLWFIIF